MTILEMSLGGALLIAVILLLRRLALYRLPKWSFLLLWAVALCRLLVPFAVPSPVSVYTGAARVAQLFEPEQPSAVVPDTPPSGFFADVPEDLWADHWAAPAVPTTPEKGTSVSPLAAVYWMGVALCGLFFTAACLWSLRRFWNAVPAEQDFVRRWKEEHPTLFPVQIKICKSVTAPLAYGLVRPVVLLPANTDWSCEDQLTYILTHEYVHIRRGDLFWKLLLAGALCLHWFNPLVWLMCLRANQDLELACDERVVWILGLDNRKGYAYALLAAAESGFSPLCITYKTKSHMEERIRAIMKMKKRSAAVILTAALLVTGVTTVFATSKAPTPQDIETPPQAVMSNAIPSPAPDQKPDSAPDASAAAVPEPSTVAPDAPGTVNRIHPVTGEPAEPAAAVPDPQETEEPAESILENRWSVPDGEIPQFTEFTVDSFEDAHELGKYLEATHDLYPGDYVSGRVDGTRYIVQVTYQERAIRERLPDGVYPVNSKGETYGTAMDSIVVGYDPDLILVQATNGESGYAVNHDLSYGGYPGEINTPDDAMAYMEWRETQHDTILIPVYDVNRDTIIGYFELSRDSDMTPEEYLNMVADQMRRNKGLSEEEIAKELEALKAVRGWN